MRYRPSKRLSSFTSLKDFTLVQKIIDILEARRKVGGQKQPTNTPYLVLLLDLFLKVQELAPLMVKGHLSKRSAQEQIDLRCLLKGEHPRGQRVYNLFYR